jgi:hypothetical protein
VLSQPGCYTDIVWFSSNQDWERTVWKAIRYPDGTTVQLDSMEELAEYCGLVRFGVAPETAPHDWRALKELSGMSARLARGLYEAAIERGANPNEWFGTFDPVPRELWVAVEVYENGKWVRVSGKENVARGPEMVEEAR